MYGNGDRKTVSELMREAAATRRRLSYYAAHLERVQNAAERARSLIERMLRIFARELDANDRDNFLTVLTSTSEDLEIANLPLLPIVIALSNYHFTELKRIYAVGNCFVDDSSVKFLAYVLRFSPLASQIELLDISGTRVTEQGLCFLLDMMQEREIPFTLIAKDRVQTESSPDAEVNERYQLLLEKVRAKSNCTLKLSSES
ncbi:uncharacterized protein Tco025E_04921 [Trypanosoma conorhini]|uniref:Uncharacterized protein n=1 Tax=Trypanosoma conorhini TaxID=83891 RepID=A0A3R7L6G9_9TRYP|nr:uncharacterized protein Tco025E_04921 [Trypanosoma conorhini]RNF17182.1 hypothetical protein Tco025E_04921 [Trypanosoma conorhini]